MAVSPLAAAEEACRMVFGPTPSQPPVLPLPRPLRGLLADWPGHPAEPLDVALQLPPTSFEIDRYREGKTLLNLQLRCCRVTILCDGKRVGYALRTDDLGLDAIRVWHEAEAIYQRTIRQAH